MSIFEVENPVRLVHELKGAPLSIVVVLGLVHQRVSQGWLENATGYTDKSVARALGYLQEVGLVDHTSSGWQLIENRPRQLPLPLEELEADNLTPSPSPQAGRGEEEESRRNSDSNESVVVVVNNNQLNLIKTTTTNLNCNESGKIPTQEEIQQVLDAAEDLFGQRIMGEARLYADTELLLAWIEQAYFESRREDRGRVRNPAGLVYWAFQNGKKPLKKYLRDPGRNLPESFQRASGQWEFEDE